MESVSKAVQVAPATESTTVAAPKKRGRPAGSVNKTAKKPGRKPKAIKTVKVQAESVTAPVFIKVYDMMLTVEQAREAYEFLKRLFAK